MSLAMKVKLGDSISIGDDIKVRIEKTNGNGWILVKVDSPIDMNVVRNDEYRKAKKAEEVAFSAVIKNDRKTRG